MHELKTNEELQSLKGIFVPMKPETAEGLKDVMLRRVSKARQGNNPAKLRCLINAIQWFEALQQVVLEAYPS